MVLSRNQVEVPQVTSSHRWHRDERRVTGKICQHGRSQLDPLIVIALNLMELVIDHPALGEVQFDRTHEMPDKVAVSFVGGNAAG